MGYDILIYIVVFWFIFTTTLFMITILYIDKTEIRNSKKIISSKLCLYYSIEFNKIKISFENSLHELFAKSDQNRVLDFYIKNRIDLYDSRRKLSTLLVEHSANNEFLFIIDNKIRKDIIKMNSEVIINFQEWSNNLTRIFEITDKHDKNDDKINLLLNKIEENQLLYQKIIELIIEIRSKLTNDVFEGIFKITE